MIDHEPIFRDSVLNQRLFEEGYITLPFLDQEEVEDLRQLFWNHHSAVESAEGLHISSHIKEDSEIQHISDQIQKIFKRAIVEHIENGMTLGGTFISKPPNQTEPLQPHQDWSIVDESRFRSFTIWVPLEDVTDENGCMYVLPKSHEYVRGYRHISIDSVFGQIYETVWKHMEPVYLKAGEAIVFDHALGHASKPNTTDKVRIAATHSLISRNHEMRFYWNNNGVVEEYVGKSDFYNTPEAKTGPIGLKKIRDLDFKPHQLTEEEFLNLLNKVATNDSGKSRWATILLNRFLKMID
ncbi:MAG: hypothetical protein RL266_248 [Bacteroidota bacterium]